MQKIKKFLLTGIIILFLLNNFSQSISAQVNDILNIDLEKINTDKKQIIFYRIDINGKIQPIQIEMKLEKYQNENTKITEKCKELFENDEQLQNSINNNNENLRWIEVMLEGKGFHWSFRKIWITNRNVIWRTIIRYRYFYESDYTKIRFKENEEWRYLLNGSQKIQLKGFTGYVYFQPKSIWGNTTICGKVLGIDWATPKWPKI